MTRSITAARDEAKPYLNRWGPIRLTRDALSPELIWRFCEVAEDANPVYWDAAFATTTRFGRLIAPPQSILSVALAWWTPDYRAERLQQEADRLSEGAGIGGTEVMDIVTRLGYEISTVASNETEYLSPFGPGDGRLKARSMTVDVSDEKQTRPGRGVFITSVMEHRTEVGDRPVARTTLVLLRYDPTTPRG